MVWLVTLALAVFVGAVLSTAWESLDLPPAHLPFYFHSQSHLRGKCVQDSSCPFQTDLEEGGKCWGHEKDCNFTESYSFSKIICPKGSNWPSARAKADQIRLFWNQADFGFLRERLDHMKEICSSSSSDASRLVCSDHLRYCYAENIFFDFKSLRAAKFTNKYREDVINEREVGGRCSERLRRDVLLARSDHKSPLQSWAAELGPFESRDDFRMDSSHCDVIFERPTILIKLDAAVSMFHHFCDFVNLYASQHLNGSFSRDVDIVLWDTSAFGFSDSFFGITWEAFTSHPLVQLKDLDQKKVCFRQALFPLLARQRLGFYYNMPLVDGCEGSGFFHAFSEHVLHRLGVVQMGPLPRRLRLTLLSRSTKYRRILNEEQLLGALKTIRELDVKKVDFNHGVPFKQQLETTQNTDILIGMHGSGLTHLLFLPDWAAVFEIYNCGDPNCYWDLARLRGVRYRTWEKARLVQAQDEGHHPTLGAHEKFTNYKFDVQEFVRIVTELVDYVSSHPQFLQRRGRLHPQQKQEL